MRESVVFPLIFAAALNSVRQANTQERLLTKMVFSSSGCGGCEQEGVSMILTGTFLQYPSPQCNIINLDHPAMPDFSQTSTFVATEEELNIGWYSCYEAPLDGMVSAALVTWTGTGTWYPDSICFDWDRPSSFVSICTFEAGTTLTYGQEAALQCSVGDSTQCEAADECKTDNDCNSGLTGVCEADVAEPTQCKYCTFEGGKYVCKPGCKYDASSNNIPRCSPERPNCNENHHCQANTGSELLTKITFTSSGCGRCEQEGVSMVLTGTQSLLPVPQCETIDLDHPDRPDFSQHSTFVATQEEADIGWYTCWNAPLDGMVSAAVVTWTGSGTWYPDHICFEWDKHTSSVSMCRFESGTSLTFGQEAALSCLVFEGVERC